MINEELDTYFEDFINKKSIFRDKKSLQANFTPDTIPHRDEEIKTIAKILAPSLKSDKPSNLFIYGKTGTGKTISVNHIMQKLMKVAEKKKLPLKSIYLNCKLKKVADTEYRLIAQIARELGQEIPITGLPTEEVYKILFNLINKQNSLFLLVLDEIDQLVKKTGDEILYNLTRMNAELETSQISIIGISNDLFFRDNLDPRVISSLSEEEVVFPPYNALQLKDILKQRADISFEKGTIDQGVIEKCAAYAAREHGDARRALELLRVAGELAERNNSDKIVVQDIDTAEDKIENDRVFDIIKTQPKQHQVTLFSIISICSRKESQIFTGEVYELYNEVCLKTGIRPLTQRGVSDVIGELDMLGIINAKVISKGRYGRTRDITLPMPKSVQQKIKNILEEGLNLS